jgi:glycosyltransferase involved in cell wall biosynthesis
VVLSDGMADRIEAQGQRRERIRVIPNWADGKSIAPLAPEKNRFRAEHGFERRFVAMYSGNLGVGHEIVVFIEAARRLERERPELLFVFVGDGARRREAEQAARQLSNVRFLPYQPRERLAESLSAADLHLGSLGPGLEGLLVPSKLYGILAAGRPLLFVGPERCELAQVVGREGVGWHCRPRDLEGICAALRGAVDDRVGTAALGRRARSLFEARYDRPHAVSRWKSALAEAVGSSR